MAAPKSPITCHVLDSSTGKPASGVEVTLQLYISPALSGGTSVFEAIGKGTTDQDGRCLTLLPPPGSSNATETSILKEGGMYKIIFRTKEYFESSDRKSFYPCVEITFEIANPTEHYHVPLLISPYSYTTYRGS